MKFFKWLIAVIVIIIAAGATVHFVRDYDRVTAQKPDISVTIPEGSTVYDIDRILSAAGIIQPGELDEATSALAFEGKLFPDTYDFYPSSTASEVVAKMFENFNAKAAPLFDATNTNDGGDSQDALIVASMVQKEVPGAADQAIVAGIIDKRLAEGIPLDIDATICYIKQQENPTSTAACVLTAADFKINSPYNTYRYKGLPPAPIGNPGLQAIEAALNPQTSTYLYYLSDPKTGDTIYAKTLAQQEANQKKYLQ